VVEATLPVVAVKQQTGVKIFGFQNTAAETTSFQAVTEKAKHHFTWHGFCLFSCRYIFIH